MSDRLTALPLIEAAKRRNTAVALPALDPKLHRIHIYMEPGLSIDHAVTLAFPMLNEEARKQVRVTFGGHDVPQEMWARVRPKVWDTILIRVIPGASPFFLTALLVAVTVAAFAVGQLWVGPLLAGTVLGEAAVAAGTVGSKFIIAATTAALVGGVQLAAGHLIPAASKDGTAPAQAFAIDGFQNPAFPGGPVPVPLGAFRFSPPYAAMPYTEIVGNDQYFVALFLCGFAPLTISDVFIGLTPIETFGNVECEIIPSYTTGDGLPFYERQVIEERLSIALSLAEGGQTRISARAATAFSIDLFFPGGQFQLDNDGKEQFIAISYKIEARPVGGGAFTEIATLSLAAKSRTPFWRSYEWTAPSRGQYEIKGSRLSGDDEFALGKLISKSTWFTLRSFRPEAPLNYPVPVTLVAIRIKSNGKLNGMLESVNVLASRPMLDWDSGTGTWVQRATQNPASIARFLRQGQHNVLPDPDARLDLDDFAAWHEFCTATGLKFNGVFDQPVARDEAFRQVCHAGRAMPYKRGDKISIIVDRPRTQFLDHISSRNSSGLRESHPTVAFPDAISVKFFDETNNFAPAQRIIPWVGKEAIEPSVIEEWQMPGKTSPDEVWREPRRRMYEAIYRDRTWTVNQDFEHLAIGRGDAALLAHPVIDREQFAGRVRSVQGDLITLDIEVEILAGVGYRCRFRAANNVTSVVRSVINGPGRTHTLRVAGPGAMPSVGDLAMFGRASSTDIEVIVRNIEQGENFSGTLTLVPHAPGINGLADAEIPPPWDGRVGVEVGLLTFPAIPVIIRIFSFQALDADGLPAMAFPDGSVGVELRSGVGGARSAEFEVQHRQFGATPWTTVTIAAAEGVAVIDGYEFGGTIEVRARALTSVGVPSSYTAINLFHITCGPTFDTTNTRFDSDAYSWDMV